MAFKEKSEKELLKLSKDEQIKYWEEFKEYYTQKKKDIQKKIRQTEQQQKQKNKKKIDHATFVLFGALIQSQSVKSCIAELSKNNSFTDREKEDINLLLESRGIELRF
uniref:GRIP domain-containing protein n=1 Tax=uncultured prokaryote TaxID=198431 RepID=A0A0H5PYT1_9ZZZZ|nr:unnamed protein product [uncultured bacterium]CRY94901.1 hypothetical protein [uncultured prokaryote]